MGRLTFSSCYHGNYKLGVKDPGNPDTPIPDPFSTLLGSKQLCDILSRFSAEKKIKKEEMEAALKIATTYLGTEILEELKTSSDLPNNINGLLDIGYRHQDTQGTP